MRIAYIDCFSGAAGDMFLGALIDAGVPRSVLEDAVASLPIDASLQFEAVDRSGIAAVEVHVLENGRLADALTEEPSLAAPYLAGSGVGQHSHGIGHVHPHVSQNMAEPETNAGVDAQPHVDGRSLSSIRTMIEESALAYEVKALAIRTFELLGQSEARIHNVAVEEVHFHEVGAVDAIADIVAAAAGLVYLGIDVWHCSAVNVGAGTVRCAHGVFPVPAPATADLLRGAPTYSAHLQKELVTPTGAALLRALEPSFGPQPAMVVERIGYGAGTRNPPGFPNVLRLCVGEAHASATEAVPSERQTILDRSDATHIVSVLEAALDDATPQLLAYVAEQALRLGALDVMLTPVVMKKGRPGTMLTVLAKPEDSEAFASLLLRETTTLGLRVRQDRRICLNRSHIPVETEYGTVRIKTGSTGDATLNELPEFEDCRKAAEENGVPLKRVQAAAMAAYLSRPTEGRQS